LYTLSYAEVLEGDSREARMRERIVFDRAIELMKKAEKSPPRAPERLQAVQFVQRLWGYFVQDLTDPDNELADNLKSDLVSIGLWSIAEADRILTEKKQSFAALIEVNTSIRDGLK